MFDHHYSRAFDQGSLLDVCIGLQKANTVFETVWFLSQSLATLLDLEDCVIYLMNPKKRLEQVAAYGPKCGKPYEIKQALELELGQGVVGHAALTREPQLIGETGKSNIYLIDDQSRASELAVPIMYRDTLLGVIDSEHSHRAFYDERHEEIFQLIAAMAGQTIHFLTPDFPELRPHRKSGKEREHGHVGQSVQIPCCFNDFKHFMKNLHQVQALHKNSWLTSLSKLEKIALQVLAERVKNFIQARIEHYDGLARYRCYARVLQATYIEAGRKQLQIAADLNLADSTYRRYLRRGLELILSDLNSTCVNDSAN